MRKYCIQIQYGYQDEDVVDTAEFIVPDTITDKMFASSVLEVTERHDTDENPYKWHDRTNAMLDEIAESLGGEWNYVLVEGVVTVDDCGRRFKA